MREGAGGGGSRRRVGEGGTKLFDRIINFWPQLFLFPVAAILQQKGLFPDAESPYGSVLSRLMDDVL